MGKSGAERRSQRPANRQSVKSTPSSAVTRQKAARSTVPAASSFTADIDDFYLDAQQQRQQLLTTAIAQSEQLIGRAHYSEAAEVIGAVLQSHPTVAALHDLLALAYIGSGQTEEAVQHSLTACQLDADGSGDRWMYLGQLRQGREAIEAFERGAAVYRRQKEAMQHSADGEGKEEGEAEADEEESEQSEESSGDGRASRLVALSQSLSSAYVSMAELYVTDCCDEAEAEERCESLLAAAMTEWPNNADGAYATANLRLIQGDEQQAAEWLDRTVAILEQSYDPIRQPALQLLAAATNCTPMADNTAAASYELRLNVAKLAYELTRYQQCRQLIDALLEEDDSFIEVCHLAALAHLQCKQFHTATLLANQAIDMCKANTANDKQAIKQLKPVMAALRQVIQQCEGKEDETRMDDEEGEEGKKEAEEMAEEDEDGEAQHSNQQLDDEQRDESGHDRMSHTTDRLIH